MSIRTRLLMLLSIISVVASAASVLEDMELRSKESLARDSAYEMTSVKVFWGDASFLRECFHENKPLPPPFVIYFEILPDGRLGQTLFEPMTEGAICIRAHIAERRFPKPPGAYVTKIHMSFNP